MTEAELVTALKKQDHDALPYLQRHYGPLMRYIITPILPDQQDREEALADISMKIWTVIQTFDEQRGSFTAWLSVLSRNIAVDHARRRPPPTEELADTAPAPGSDPEQQFLQKERTRALNKAIRCLSDSERILFYRKYYYRQPTAQIAAELGTTERAIEGRLYRIKQKLRKALGGEDFD